MLRRKLRPLIPTILKASPAPLAELLVHRSPRWAGHLPPGKEIQFNRYLDDCTVIVDALYPIEREMLTGAYDPPTLKIIDRFVRPGFVAFDVGANVGALTLAMAKAGATVHAFEPGPPTFQRLERNVSLNPTLAGHITLCRVGLSDHVGVLKWAEDVNNRGNAGLLNTEGVSVPVTTLDDYCRENAVTRLDFIKVDVEGLEYEVFKGASSVLRDLRPALYFETRYEFAAVRGFNIFAEIEGLLRQHGYRLYKTADDITETTSADLSENTLALPT